MSSATPDPSAGGQPRRRPPLDAAAPRAVGPCASAWGRIGMHVMMSGSFRIDRTKARRYHLEGRGSQRRERQHKCTGSRDGEDAETRPLAARLGVRRWRRGALQHAHRGDRGQPRHEQNANHQVVRPLLLGHERHQQRQDRRRALLGLGGRRVGDRLKGLVGAPKERGAGAPHEHEAAPCRQEQQQGGSGGDGGTRGSSVDA
mmetsp:Transcript_99407/g.284338  ORF Transcript_99407/g.284338 Transcript_99407/m.284338 type:complete len:202 (+) Transcript_99407:766-1371(+)